MNADSTIANLMINGVNYFLPASIDDVICLVNKAHTDKTVVCMRGAAHSRPLISSLEEEVNDGRLYLFLSKMMAVSFNDELKQVTVEGGCHLGEDPADPLLSAPEEFAPFRSTLQNSLLYQLDQHRPDPQNPLVGWALPDLGGIIHQTVGGFLSTGSSGSNLESAFNESLVSITLVTGGTDGATTKVFSKNDPAYPDDNDNPFYAAGVALGLLGVIVSATFQCIDAFNISGQESTMLEADCPIDLFGDKPQLQSLEAFFRSHRYKRIMWWPQQGVTKAVVWQADPMPIEAGFVPNPYQEVPEIKILGFETSLPAELGAYLMLNGFADIPVLLDKINEAHPILYKLLMKIEADKIVPFLLNIFVPADPVKDGKPTPPAFQDVWYSGIPMDNRISDFLVPVWFTELWFPIGQGPVVLSTLRTYFQQNPGKVGNFCYEIYPAKASKFWLSAAYQTDVFRIDMFWFGDNPGSPLNEFYPELWNLLFKSNLDFRPHWGKFLPDGNSTEGAAYLKSRYPNFDKFMALRATLDPHEVFLSSYWRSHLFESPNNS